MNTPVVAASPNATAREVATYMLLGGFSGMPVVENDGALAGVVTELDLLRCLRRGEALESTSIRDIMTRDVISVEPSTPVEEVMRILDVHRIQRVPVIEDGRVIGVVSRPEIVRAAVNPQLMRVV
jgi:CBS domain-containing protein